jgi:hypothetical protein
VPQNELGGDPGAVRAWVQAATELGYDHISGFDHAIGADPRIHTGWVRVRIIERCVAGARLGYERVAGLGVDTGAAPSGFPPGPDW